jgi:hypothetical protein
MALVSNNEITVGSIPTFFNLTALARAAMSAACRVASLPPNALPFFANPDPDAKFLTPCQHEECYNANCFTTYSKTGNVSEMQSAFFLCSYNYAGVKSHGKSYWQNTPHYIMSVECLPEAIRWLVISQQDDMIANQVEIENECKAYSPESMKIRDEARRAFIEIHWPGHPNIADQSHPRYTMIAQCDDRHWPASDGEPNCPTSQSNWLIALPYPLHADAAFDADAALHDATIRIEKDGTKMVCFRHKYSRKGCWYELVNGFCNGKAWDNVSPCTKMHKTFYGDASIVDLTRAHFAREVDASDWRSTLHEARPIDAPIDENWRATLQKARPIAAEVSVSTPPIAKKSLTPEGAQRLHAMILAHFAAGEPIPVNPQSVVDAPTNPWPMTEQNLQTEEWADSMDKMDEPEGLEYLCLKLIKVMKAETFFGPGVHTVSDMRPAITDFLKTV